MENFAVVIPAYNEANTIGALIDSVLPHAPEIIVVNDASSDNTAAIVKQKPVLLIEHAHNRGKAAALASAFAKARELRLDFVISMDGDGQHDASDIPKFLAARTRYPQHLIVGARLYNREQAPKSRLFFNRFANFWVSWAAGRAIADSQCGFRLYPLAIVERVNVRKAKKHSFVFESEVLVDTSRQGFGVVFVPIRSCYPDNRRKSHFRPVYDIVQITLMVAKKLLRRGLYPLGLVKSVLDKPVIVGDESA
ncbi:MAG: glycosyltransferase family 2 protein [Gammaproteobacteria bacterium]